LESLFLDLRQILEQQKNTLKQLLDTARDHNRALRQLELPALREAVRSEEEITSILRRQEEKRSAIASQLADQLGLPEDAVLSAFIDRAPALIQGEMLRLLDEMACVAGELPEISRINGLLAKQALRVNGMLLRAFGAAGSQLYTPGGVTRQEQQLVSLVDKEI